MSNKVSAKRTSAKSLRTWVRRHFDDKALTEIIEYGADKGWVGITSTEETDLLFRKFQPEMIELFLTNTGFSTRYNNVCLCLADFEEYKQHLVWLTVEHYAEILAGDWAERPFNR